MPNTRAYQLEITLRDVHPPIWRRLEVPALLPLPVLHDAFQVAMGWTDSHLHLFRAGDRIWCPLEADSSEAIGNDTAGVLLAQIAPRRGSRFVYEYDFGDDWIHDVLVEAVLDGAPPGLRCLEGKRACPPEDCGGPWGYAEYLEILADPDHEDYEERREWFGDHDIESFDLGEANALLQQVWLHATRSTRSSSSRRSRRARPRGELGGGADA